MECYCTDERKGHFLRKVERSLETANFCAQCAKKNAWRCQRDPDCGWDEENQMCVDESGREAEMTRKIRRALANRMFHLCENWCLWDVEDPTDLYWYWSPWEKCWREQWDGLYCHREHVVKNSWEMQYMIHRSNNFCNFDEDLQDLVPGRFVPGAPENSAFEDIEISWEIASKDQSCDATCAGAGLQCNADQITSIKNFEGVTDEAKLAWNSLVIGTFMKAGTRCDEVITGNPSFALPAYRGSSTDKQPTVCITRSKEATSDPCAGTIGGNYRRLCACSV